MSDDDFIPLAQPRVPSFSPSVSDIAAHIRRRNDEVVLKALRARVGPDCTLESLAGRLHSQVTPSGTTYMLDDTPFIWVGAPKFAQDEASGTISVDREWKELP